MKNLTNKDKSGGDSRSSHRELLNKEVYRRSTPGIFAHTLFSCGVMLSLDKFYEKTSYPPFPVILLLIGIFLRILCIYFFKSREHLRRALFLIGTITLGVGWGELTLQIVTFYGVESIQTMIAIGFISTMVAISVSSLSACPGALVSFLVTCTAYPSYVLFSQKEALWHYLGAFFLINFLYQIYAGFRNYRSINKQIRELSKEKREKQRLQEIIDAIPSLVLIINEQKTYEMVNNFQDGFFQKLLLGQDVGVFPNSPVEGAFLSFFNSEKNSESLELQAFDFGPEEWYMVTMNRLNLGRSIICNILPITEFVKTRNELQIQKARNEYSSKLITLGEVAANITHELGNPLAILRGSTQVLKSELVDFNLSKIAEKKLSVIDTTIGRMGSIIRGLKAISQSQGLEHNNVKFRDLIEPVREITSAKMQEYDITFNVKGEESDVDLFCDSVQLTQVILNLVDNAIDAICHNDERWINVSYRPGFEWCEIIVQDSGKISNSEVVQNMMIPFFTTKNKQVGTGLGLSLSEKILQEHHGRLTFLRDEENTTFLIKLPRMTY